MSALAGAEESEMSGQTEKIYTAIRREYPHSRRHGVCGIVSNGSSKRVYDCIVCGDTHSHAATWPEPKHSKEWRREHEAACGEKLLARIAVQS
jgi:hypothetical protein